MGKNDKDENVGRLEEIDELIAPGTVIPTAESVGLKAIGSDSFATRRLLGVGSQGKVYLVQLVGTERFYAMKVFKKQQIIQNEKTTDSILTEHRFLATSNHPFITKLLYSFHSAERLFMIMEYCPGGELFTAIKKQPHGRLNEEQVKFYTSEVVLVLEYVHSKGYIYRDLKPENILLHLDGHIRMADFGLSKQQAGYKMNVIVKNKRKSIFGKKETTLEHDPGEVVRTNSLVGSVHYLAPEVLQCTGYDAMADWWALGVLMYDMLFGFPPFQGKTNHEVFTKILNCEYSFPDDIPVSGTVKDLMKRLLKLDPRKRLGIKGGAAEIKKHPFFNGIHWGLLRNRKPPIIPVIRSPDDTSNFMSYEDDEDREFEFFSELEDENLINPNSKPIDQRFNSFKFADKDFVEPLRHANGLMEDEENNVDQNDKNENESDNESQKNLSNGVDGNKKEESSSSSEEEEEEVEENNNNNNNNNESNSEEEKNSSENDIDNKESNDDDDEKNNDGEKEKSDDEENSSNSDNDDLPKRAPPPPVSDENNNNSKVPDDEEKEEEKETEKEEEKVEEEKVEEKNSVNSDDNDNEENEKEQEQEKEEDKEQEQEKEEDKEPEQEKEEEKESEQENDKAPLKSDEENFLDEHVPVGEGKVSRVKRMIEGNETNEKNLPPLERRGSKIVAEKVAAYNSDN